MYYKFYERCMLISHINAGESEPCLSDFFFFFYEMNAKNIVKEPTCYKSLSNPNCIDLFTTNSSSSFQNTKTTSMGLYDFLKMAITVLKQTFPRPLPKKLVYKDNKNIDRLTIKRPLEEKLNHQIN